MNETVYSFEDITDLTRILSKLKKKYPDSSVISLNKMQINKQVAVGFIDTTVPLNTEEQILTVFEIDKNKIENYKPVIVIG